MGDLFPASPKSDVVSCTRRARSSYSMKERDTKSKKDACTGCFDAIQPRQPHFKAPCGHMYCKDCGVRFVTSYTSEEPLFDVVISPSLRTKYDPSYLQLNSMRYCKGTKNIGRLCEGGFIAPILPANSLSRLGRWHYVCSSLGRSSVPAVRRGSAPNVGNLRIKGANAMVRESIPSNLKRW